MIMKTTPIRWNKIPSHSGSAGTVSSCPAPLKFVQRCRILIECLSDRRGPRLNSRTGLPCRATIKDWHGALDLTRQRNARHTGSSGVSVADVSASRRGDSTIARTGRTTERFPPAARRPRRNGSVYFCPPMMGDDCRIAARSMMTLRRRRMRGCAWPVRSMVSSGDGRRRTGPTHTDRI